MALKSLHRGISMGSEEIDVVIPSCNAAEQIEECLDHVFASDYENFQVTVVDDHSSDDSLARVARYASVNIIALKENKGVSAARNQGISETRGDIILLIDSDVLIPKTLLRQVDDFFSSHPEISLLQGRYEDRPYYQNLFSQYKHFVFSFRGANPNHRGQRFANFVHTACVAVRRDVFSQVAFNHDLSRGEDFYFGQSCIKAGFKIFPDTTLTVGHKKKYTLLSYTRYQFRAARDMIQQRLMKKSDNAKIPLAAKNNPLHKKLWVLRPVVGFFFLAALLAAALGWGDTALILLALLLAASFLLEVQFRVYLFKFAPLWFSIAAWPLYFFDGIVTGLGLASGILASRCRK
jgi:glycosyltransferase involved in cell wall biosynthesis